MDAYPLEAWQELARALRLRRTDLGYPFGQFSDFAARRSRPGLRPRTLARLERAQRRSYPPETLALVDKVYEWPAGRAAAILEEAAARAERTRLDAPGWIARHWDDPAVRETWRNEQIPRDAREGMIRWYLDGRAAGEPGAGPSPRPGRRGSG